MTSTLWQDVSLYSTRSKSFSVSISRSTIHAPHWKVKRRGGAAGLVPAPTLSEYKCHTMKLFYRAKREND